MARGRVNRGLSEQYRHISIYITKSDWDRLNYLADGTNKTVSRYIADILSKTDKTPSAYKPEEQRVVKPLCLKIDEHETIKANAERYNMSVSNYILGIIL